MTSAVEERCAEVEGRPVRWLEDGEGAPVLFLQGPRSPADLWRYVVPLLPGVRALCLAPAGEEREPDAAALGAWLAGFGGEPAVVVAHGRGCTVAQALALARPDLVAGLVLVGTGRRRLFRRPRVDTRVRTLGLPAIVVWGDRADLRLGRRAADALGAELDLVEDARRSLPEDHPGRVAQAIGRVAAMPRGASAGPPAPRPARSSSHSEARTRRARPAG